MSTPTRQQRRSQERKQAKPGAPRPHRWWLWVAALIGAVLVIGALALLNSDDKSAVDKPAKSKQALAGEGLPESPDYHSLIVAPDDPEQIFLGTHQGLFETTDGGVTWSQTGAIEGDAMNLARDAKNASVMYAAGHQLFQKSTDAGKTWQNVPLDDAISQTRAIDGAKAVDIHGFAADPTNADTVYAAVAGKGLYKSTDAGESFTKLSDTGAAGFGVALTTTLPQIIYLADTQQGLLRSRDSGKTWTTLQDGVTSVAIAANNQHRVLAAGRAIFLSTNGTDFIQVEQGPTDGFGPITFAPSDPKIAYAVGYDREFYVSADGGATWRTR